MPSLKDYRDRIDSVKSTRKITSAMKMVAASKLKRAQDQAEASQPYAQKMAEMLARLAANTEISASSPKLIAGTGKDDTHLIVLISSDRGLCGGFNAYVARLAKEKIDGLLAAGKTVKIICVGSKGRSLLKRDYDHLIIKRFEGIGKQRLSFADADQITGLILELLDEGAFDICTVIYNQFKNVITQTPQAMQLVPFAIPDLNKANDNEAQEKPEEKRALYEFEPGEEEILERLLPRNLAVQVFRALLDSAAGEQAARMTAMDNATRNAGDKIDDLTLQYNRQRQAYITKELIEIISGAEAL